MKPDPTPTLHAPMSPPIQRPVSPGRSATALVVALLGAVSLAGCRPPAESGPARAADADASLEGQGLVLLIDPDNTTEKAPMRPDGTYQLRPNFYDFGTVPDGETPSYVFRLRNTDPQPVAINKVNPSCGCTVPSLRYTDRDGQIVRGLGQTVRDRPHIVVPPDAILEVEVRIDTTEIKTKNADKLNTVTISTDSPNSYYLQLETHILVEAPFNVVPMTLDLGRIPQSAGGDGSVDIVPALGFYGWRAAEILSAPEDMHCELLYANLLGNDTWTLSSRFVGGAPLGRQTREIVVSTRNDSDEPGPDITIPVVAMVVEDIQFEPGRFVFRAAQDGRFSVRMRSLLDGHRYGIVAAELPAEHATLLSVQHTQEDETLDGKSNSWRLTLTVSSLEADVSYPLRGKLRLRLDDPQHPEVEVGYVIHPPLNPGGG